MPARWSGIHCRSAEMNLEFGVHHQHPVGTHKVTICRRGRLHVSQIKTKANVVWQNRTHIADSMRQVIGKTVTYHHDGTVPPTTLSCVSRKNERQHSTCFGLLASSAVQLGSINLPTHRPPQLLFVGGDCKQSFLTFSEENIKNLINLINLKGARFVWRCLFMFKPT